MLRVSQHRPAERQQLRSGPLAAGREMKLPKVAPRPLGINKFEREKKNPCEIVSTVDFSCRTVQPELSRSVMNPESQEGESAIKTFF